MTGPMWQEGSIVVRRPGSPDGPNPIRPISRMMLIPEEGQGRNVLIPYAPRDIEFLGIAGHYVTLTRPGLVDALLYSRPSLKKLSFTLVLVDRTLRGAGQVPGTTATNIDALDTINLLSQYASAGTKMRMAYSSLEAGSWRITTFQPRSLLRDEVDEITHATAEVELTQAVDAIVGVGPVTGGVTTPPPPPPPQQAPPATAYYTVVRGDTLWAIAVAYYGNGNRWSEIADANGITDPRSLQIGTVLRIP